ncbi:hypothetical protein AURDEDRAFT_176333 [Auricularia subglabra TFB-10046 SS5]|nr:hypothetical protein AURDEDRAFT_176333 [Auricularia subglabra TFB-10046 SS5]
MEAVQFNEEVYELQGHQDEDDEPEGEEDRVNETESKVPERKVKFVVPETTDDGDEDLDVVAAELPTSYMRYTAHPPAPPPAAVPAAAPALLKGLGVLPPASHRACPASALLAHRFVIALCLVVLGVIMAVGRWSTRRQHVLPPEFDGTVELVRKVMSEFAHPGMKTMLHGAILTRSLGTRDLHTQPRTPAISGATRGEAVVDKLLSQHTKTRSFREELLSPEQRQTDFDRSLDELVKQLKWRSGILDHDMILIYCGSLPHVDDKSNVRIFL